jgi:hypothetical protein
MVPGHDADDLTDSNKTINYPNAGPLTNEIWPIARRKTKHGFSRVLRVNRSRNGPKIKPIFCKWQVETRYVKKIDAAGLFMR